MVSLNWTECAEPITRTSVKVAKAPSGRTEAGTEGERSEDSDQHPRGQSPLPFFYQRCFVREPPNLQQFIELTDGIESSIGKGPTEER